MEFCELSYQIFVLLNLCCVSFVVGLALLLLSILVKTSFAVKFFAYFLILVAFFLCIIIAVKLFEPYNRRFINSRLRRLNTASARQAAPSFQMDCPPSYDEVIQNPCAFPKTVHFMPNSYNIQVTNTTQSRINCSEAEGTSGDIQESDDVNMPSLTGQNRTLTRTVREEDNSALPPYCDVVFWVV